MMAVPEPLEVVDLADVPEGQLEGRGLHDRVWQTQHLHLVFAISLLVRQSIHAVKRVRLLTHRAHSLDDKVPLLIRKTSILVIM